MKRLYARLVLWLIRPALEAKAYADRVVIEHAIRAANDAVVAEIRMSMQRGGVFCQLRADRDRISEILAERQGPLQTTEEARRAFIQSEIKAGRN